MELFRPESKFAPGNAEYFVALIALIPSSSTRESFMSAIQFISTSRGFSWNLNDFWSILFTGVAIDNGICKLFVGSSRSSIWFCSKKSGSFAVVRMHYFTGLRLYCTAAAVWNHNTLIGEVRYSREKCKATMMAIQVVLISQRKVAASTLAIRIRRSSIRRGMPTAPIAEWPHQRRWVLIRMATVPKPVTPYGRYAFNVKNNRPTWPVGIVVHLPMGEQ